MSQTRAVSWTPESLAGELQDLSVGELRLREPMAEHTTLRVGGPADVYVEVSDRDALRRLLRHLRLREVPWLVLGNGSNLLVRDGGIAGAVISLRRLEGLEILDADSGRVAVEAGVHLTRLVRLGLEQGFEGVWFLSGIPGTLGGAVRMNAGTRYGEIQQVVESVTLMSGAGTMKEVPRDSLKFAYRTLALPRDRLVLAATLRLGRAEPDTVRARHKEVMSYRTSTQPLTQPSVGSVFRNPPPDVHGQGMAAGKLIELSGLKGVRVRGAQISERHANWIVNVGEARAADVLTLIRLIRDRVKQDHGVVLELEAKVVGHDAAGPGEG